MLYLKHRKTWLPRVSLIKREKVKVLEEPIFTDLQIEKVLTSFNRLFSLAVLPRASTDAVQPWRQRLPYHQLCSLPVLLRISSSFCSRISHVFFFFQLRTTEMLNHRQTQY